MKTLTAQEYCPNLRPNWSIQQEIIKRVQRESECSVVLPTLAPIKKMEFKLEKWSETAIRAFRKQISGLRI